MELNTYYVFLGTGLPPVPKFINKTLIILGGCELHSPQSNRGCFVKKNSNNTVCITVVIQQDNTPLWHTQCKKFVITDCPFINNTYEAESLLLRDEQILFSNVKCGSLCLDDGATVTRQMPYEVWKGTEYRVMPSVGFSVQMIKNLRVDYDAKSNRPRNRFFSNVPYMYYQNFEEESYMLSSRQGQKEIVVSLKDSVDEAIVYIPHTLNFGFGLVTKRWPGHFLRVLRISKRHHRLPITLSNSASYSFSGWCKAPLVYGNESFQLELSSSFDTHYFFKKLPSLRISQADWAVALFNYVFARTPDPCYETAVFNIMDQFDDRSIVSMNYCKNIIACVDNEVLRVNTQRKYCIIRDHEDSGKSFFLAHCAALFGNVGKKCLFICSTTNMNDCLWLKAAGVTLVCYDSSSILHCFGGTEGPFDFVFVDDGHRLFYNQTNAKVFKHSNEELLNMVFGCGVMVVSMKHVNNIRSLSWSLFRLKIALSVEDLSGPFSSVRHSSFPSSFSNVHTRSHTFVPCLDVVPWKRAVAICWFNKMAIPMIKHSHVPDVVPSFCVVSVEGTDVESFCPQKWRDMHILNRVLFSGSGPKHEFLLSKARMMLDPSFKDVTDFKDELCGSKRKSHDMAKNVLDYLTRQEPQFDCTICFESVEEKRITCFLPCQHSICTDCFDNLHGTKCPMCKTTIQKNLTLCPDDFDELDVNVETVVDTSPILDSVASFCEYGATLFITSIPCRMAKLCKERGKKVLFFNRILDSSHPTEPNTVVVTKPQWMEGKNLQHYGRVFVGCFMPVDQLNMCIRRVVRSGSTHKDVFVMFIKTPNQIMPCRHNGVYI